MLSFVAETQSEGASDESSSVLIVIGKFERAPRRQSPPLLTICPHLFWQTIKNQQRSEKFPEFVFIDKEIPARFFDYTPEV